MRKMHIMGTVLQGVFFVWFLVLLANDLSDKNYGWAALELVFMIWAGYWFTWNMKKLRKLNHGFKR